ncbi:hypothetical protein GCM10023192_76040 [Amycolatopsis samaneae]
MAVNEAAWVAETGCAIAMPPDTATPVATPTATTAAPNIFFIVSPPSLLVTHREVPAIVVNTLAGHSFQLT